MLTGGGYVILSDRITLDIGLTSTMENEMKKAILTIELMLGASSAVARFEMLIAGSGQTDSVEIGTNETAKIKFTRYDSIAPAFAFHSSDSFG